MCWYKKPNSQHANLPKSILYTKMNHKGRGRKNKERNKREKRYEPFQIAESSVKRFSNSSILKFGWDYPVYSTDFMDF